MRRFLSIVATIAFLAPLPLRAAETSPPVVITAQQIALHADRGLLVAEGGVAVHGTTLVLTATRAEYDLRANRLTAAGDVSVTEGSTQLSAAGYTYDFSSKRGAVDKNARVAQLSSLDALATGQQVELRPGGTITFSNAQVLAGSTFAPMASYTYAIPAPAAKDWGYSPVPSAALEWPVLVGYSSDLYEFARFRYDRYNGGGGAGLEEHFARTDRGYLALGQTVDVDGARYDLVAYQRLNQSLSQSLTASSLIGTRTWRYALSSVGRHGYAALSTSQYNATRSDDLLVTGNQRPIGRVAQLRLQADLGHDVHPGDARVSQDFRLTPGLHVDTAAVRIGASNITSSFDLGESLYDYGRATLAGSATLWGTFPLNARLLFNGGATFSHDAPPYPSTFRTYTLGATWRASDAFNFVTSLSYAHDFGQSFGNGRPQYTAALDVRVKRRNGTGIEVGTLLPFGGVGNMNRQAVVNFRFFK
jgi:lipopolysaccharide export system protein LptA